MPLDLERAARVTTFVSGLKHTKAEWMNSAFALQQWQVRDLIIPVFGMVDDLGRRLVRNCYVEIPRKNGKTELAAGLALYLLCADGEPGAEVYSAASDQEQAGIIFRAAAHMVRTNRYLSKTCRIMDTMKRIIHMPTGSIYHALSSEAATKHGYNPHAVIYDELHAAPDRELWDVLQTGMGSRRQPLMLSLTTAGFDRESICFEQHDYSARILEGAVDDPSHHAVVYGMKPGEDWKDREVWKRCNPNLGISVKLEFLEAQFRRALEMPSYQNTFRRLFLNEWTEQAERWLTLEDWDACDEETSPPDLLEALPPGVPRVFAGLDLSATTDLTALAVTFDEDGDAIMRWKFWMPEERVREATERDRVPYDKWVEQGWIDTTPGRVIDQDFIEAYVEKLEARTAVEELAYDPWNATQLVVNLEEKGKTLVEVKQTPAHMSPASKGFEREMLARKIKHGRNPVMRWMVGNAAKREDANGNIKPVKATRRGRIDGLIAGILAHDRLRRHVQIDNRSVYEERGVISI